MTCAIADRLNGATVVVTGGAGFIGAHVATSVRRDAPGATVIALDNLRRRGSELNLARLGEHGVEFVHGDVRNADDISLPGREIDFLIECSAEPSVLASRRSPGYVIQTNLVGTANCLDLARRHDARVLFLSTSRVYPIALLNGIQVVEGEARFAIAPEQTLDGVTLDGVSERFPLHGARSMYGATKLASELLIAEYGASYGLQYVIDRFGVVAGPGQMGTGEQGVFTYWMARHYFGGELTYRGWGGTGKQVRDLLHVEDLWQLLRQQIERWDHVQGRTYNAGGGAAVSLSLREATRLCQAIAGRQLPMHGHADSDPSDVRIYQTDHRAVTADTGWQPSRNASAILSDTYSWIRDNETRLAPVFRER
jgi:CDP-paratose 2-epimerase